MLGKNLFLIFKGTGLDLVNVVCLLPDATCNIKNDKNDYHKDEKV
jgi:hypothetical protein